MLKTMFRYLLAVCFVVAGANHFRHPDFYISMMPPVLPWPAMWVYLSGVAEVGLGVALLVPSLQRIAAWGLIVLLIAVFPANVHMATHPGEFSSFSPILLWLRLPLQAVFIAWAYWFT